MTETPREYKKRIDETREKRKANRDKLLECLENYELVDERFKTKIKKEILANFEKNENTEKLSELYTKIGEELDTIEIKYQSLETLKELLETKNKEKTEIVEKLRGFSMTGKDETTLNLQRTEMKKLEAEMKKLNEEMKEIGKAIQERECEIKETEEIYGEKIKKESKNQNSDDSKTENINNTQLKFSEGATRPASLRDYRRFVINQLNGINNIRHEIIKLLNDGIGVDEEIKKKIEEEVSKKFFDYYDEKQGSLRMKTAQSIKLRKNVYEINNGKNEYIGYIGGKQCYIANKCRKDGKKCLIRGTEQQGDGFDNIYAVMEIGGKPCFRAYKNRKVCIMRGTEQQGDWFDGIRNLQEIGGKPCFYAEKDGKGYIMWGSEQLGDGYDYVGENPEKIGGKPCFIVKKDWKKCLIRGTEQYSDWFDNIEKIQEIGGKPCLSAKKDGKRCVIRGTEQLGGWFDYIEYIQGIGGKPTFEAKKDGKRCVMRGAEQQGDWFENIGNLQEIGGKPCFIERRNGKERVIWGKGRYSDWYDDISELKDIGGLPCFEVKHNYRFCIVRGNEQYSKWFDYIDTAQEIGGKPCFIAKKYNKRYVMRGNEVYSIRPDNIEELQEIGGKPAFKVRGILHFQKEIGGKTIIVKSDDEGYCNVTRGGKYCGNNRYKEMGEVQEIGGKPLFWAKCNGKYYIIRGDNVYAGGFDNIEIYTEVGGEPVYYAKAKNKRYIIIGKEEYIDLNEKKFDKISDLNVIGGKLFYKAYRNGGQFFMIGKQQYTDRCNEINILNINEKEGTVTIEIKQQLEDKIKNEIITYYIVEQSEEREPDITNEKGKIGQEEENLDTLRGQREKVIIEQYEKLLNLKELIKYLNENNILENSEFLEFREKLTENFFENYGKAKEDENFKAADEEYKKLKELKKKYKTKSKEVKSKSGSNNENLKSIEEQMMKIADEAIEIECGVSIKRLMISKIRKDRDKLEESKKNILKLKHEKYRLKKQIEEQSQSYGQNIDRRKLRGKSEEELRRLLSIGKAAQAKTLKEYKEKHKKIVENFEKIIGYIKGLDLGISDELKGEIIQKIETHISNIIKEQEGCEIMKMASNTEKYLDENLESIIKKLKELKKQVKETEEKITELKEKRKNSNDEELIEINDKIYEIMQQQIRLNNEYEEIKKSTNEKLHKYDRTEIESYL